MDLLIYFFVATAIIAAGLSLIAIWSPRRVWIRALSVLLVAGLLPIAYGQFLELLSRPKPKAYAWWERNIQEAQLLGVNFDEGRAIYLWLRIDGIREPRYYAIPWRRQDAENLEDTMEQAAKSGSTVHVVKPFTNDQFKQQGGLNVRIRPPATMPMKPPRMPPKIFNPRAQPI